MTTDKHPGKADHISDFSEALAQAHALSALEQSAHFAAQLAIARWIKASALSPLPIAAPAPAVRAAWYDVAQRNFQEWLGSGGFAQYDIPCGEAPVLYVPGAQADKTPVPGGSAPVGTCID